MKRLAPTAITFALFLTLGTTKAWSQHSGSLQATAQVVDSRAAVSGMESAQNLAARWAQDPTRTASTETRYAQISLAPRSILSDTGRPETRLEIRVEYLRN